MGQEKCCFKGNSDRYQVTYVYLVEEMGKSNPVHPNADEYGFCFLQNISKYIQTPIKLLIINQKYKLTIRCVYFNYPVSMNKDLLYDLLCVSVHSQSFVSEYQLTHLPFLAKHGQLAYYQHLLSHIFKVKFTIFLPCCSLRITQSDKMDYEWESYNCR